MCSDVSTKVEKLALLLLPLCCIEKCVLTFIPVDNGSEPPVHMWWWSSYFILLCILTLLLGPAKKQ